MSRKISENTEQQILEELKKGTSYSEIVEKFKVSKGLITKIKNRSDAKLEIKKTSKKTISHRRKLRETSIKNNIIQKSEII